jgi:hypothetical protein
MCRGTTRWQCRIGARSESCPELLDGQTGGTHDPRHREGVHGVVARDGQDALTVGHHDVPSLPRDPEAGSLQRAHGVQVIDAGQSRQALPDLDLADLRITQQLIAHGEVLPDGLADARHGVAAGARRCYK